MYNIKCLNDFENEISNKPEIRKAMTGNFSIFCYMIADENTFDSIASRECRGIVFNNNTKQVVARPLHKFFNLNEKDISKEENLDFSKITNIMEKKDGSMIHTVIDNDKVLLKSKKSFISEVAINATKFVNNNLNIKQLVDYSKDINITLIFEYVSPTSRIVIDYKTESLTLLHVRDNYSGRYYTRNELIKLLNKFNNCVNLISDKTSEFLDNESGMFDLSKMKLAQKTLENIEGWVIQFENGDMVKLKTDWYLNLHHMMTATREIDIVLGVLNETLDDLKSKLVAEKVDSEVFNRITKIENKVSHMMTNLIDSVEILYNENKHLDRKNFAILLKENKYFGLLMKKYVGIEPNYKEYFIKNILKTEFTFDVISMFASNGESN